MFALLLPLLLAAVGAAVDYAHYHNRRAALQNVADSAALAGARQYVIADAKARVPVAVSQDAVRAGIARLGASGATEKVNADSDASTVTVDIGYSFMPTFLIGMFKKPLSFTVTSTAQATGSANVCVIGLKETGDDVIVLDDDATLTGDRCAIYANSSGAKPLVSKARAVLTAALSCSSGGYEGGAQNFRPAPLTDCPPREDPLETRTAPVPSGGCGHTGKKVDNGAVTLSPGVYCEGLKIDNKSDVTFNPGIYFIKDGKFEIKSKARVTGADVGFYFYGENAEISIEGDAEVALSAPLDGAMAGILFWRAATATGSGKFLVKSPNVSTLVGTIYLPSGEFIGEIDFGGDIADASAYTAIIAEKITLKKKTNLVLNSNYGATKVPVPDGVSGGDGNVFLRH